MTSINLSALSRSRATIYSLASSFADLRNCATAKIPFPNSGNEGAPDEPSRQRVSVPPSILNQTHI
jgi:hypothetical protein